MIALGDLVDDELKKLADRVYHEVAPSVAFPYVVYHFSSSHKPEKREDIILNINIWGQSENTTDIEQIAENIKNRFDNLNIATADGLLVGFYLLSRGSIPDPDRNIRRREVRLWCKTYFDLNHEIPVIENEF